MFSDIKFGLIELVSDTMNLVMLVGIIVMLFA